MCGTNGECNCKSHLENEENRKLIAVAKELEEAFKEGCVLIVPEQYLGDKLVHEEFEIKSITEFRAARGLDLPVQL